MASIIASKTVEVPYLGIRAGYAFANESFDPAKPTCVLINSMCMTAALFRPQFIDTRLTSIMNLLAIEPLGHGATICPEAQFTYWNTARMVVSVLDKLGIDKFFALGTSQGGCMVARMALLAPKRVCSFLLLLTNQWDERGPARECAAYCLLIEIPVPRNRGSRLVHGQRVSRLAQQGMLGPRVHVQHVPASVDHGRADTRLHPCSRLAG
jgi:pimeloyl-ACP methyl ester carboxylesterase